MKLSTVRAENGEIIVGLEGVEVGRIRDLMDLEPLLQALLDAVKDRAAAVCLARSAMHHTTITRVPGASTEDLFSRSREAWKCARAIEEL